MAVTAHATGTQSATVTTEHTLASSDVIVAGTFTLHVNLVNMVAGDVVELRIKQALLTGDALEVVYCQRYEGAQPADNRIAISVPISTEVVGASEVALRFTLKQTFGTSRSFKWKVLKYA